MTELNDGAYRAVRQNVARLLGDHPAGHSLPVPQCPGWTVRDLLGHLVEVCRCVLEDRGSPIDVGVKPGVTVADLLAEWQVRAVAADRMVADGGRWAGILLLDSFTHELDLRHALAEPPPSEHLAFGRAFEVAIDGLGLSLKARGLPAVLVSAAGVDHVAGDGEPTATLSGNRLDVYRSLVGRRTHQQIAELSWSTDPTPWLPAFSWGPFTPPSLPVEEAN